MLKWIIKERDKKLFVTITDTCFNEPIRYTQWWPTGLSARDYEDFIGSEATYLGDLLYGLHGWNGTKIRLSQDRSQYVDEEPVPAPKTRGLETRWYNGHWEKLTKKGWKIA